MEAMTYANITAITSSGTLFNVTVLEYIALGAGVLIGAFILTEVVSAFVFTRGVRSIVDLSNTGITAMIAMHNVSEVSDAGQTTRKVYPGPYNVEVGTKTGSGPPSTSTTVTTS